MRKVEPIILASRSPRRIELLRRIGLPFEVRPSGVIEELDEGKPHEMLAVEMARLKAEDVARRFPGQIVLGADTIVCLEERVLGKPADRAEAREMLRALRGRWHAVVTGLCVLAPRNTPWTAAESTRVKMAEFPDAELEAYLDTGEPLDKAGAYAIQGGAGRFIEALEGDYYNVVGLPLALLARGLSRYLDVSRIRVPPPPNRFAAPAQ